MNVRKQSFEITADRLIETWTIFCFFTHAGNISPETPIETQHLVIYFYSRPYLALFKSLAYFLNPVTIALSLDRSLLMCWPSIHVFCNHQGNFIYIIPESYEKFNLRNVQYTIFSPSWDTTAIIRPAPFGCAGNLVLPCRFLKVEMS